jgi:hypothetical protein
VYLGRGYGVGEADLYKADDITAGVTLEGPALIQSATTTLVLLPGFSVSAGSRGDFIVRAGRLSETSDELLVGAIE